MHRPLARLLSLLLVVTATLTASVAVPHVPARSSATQWPAVLAVKVAPGATVPAVRGIQDTTSTFPGAAGDPEQEDLARWFTVEVATGAEAAVAEVLGTRADVEIVERIPIAVPASTPNDPHVDRQWHLEAIGAPRAWDHVGGTSLRLGVIDTQFDLAHPDLAGRLEDRTGRVDAVEVYAPGCAWSTRYADHGTLVAGVAAATADNGRGGAGVARGAQVVAVQAGRAIDGECYVSHEWVAALRDLAADRVPVVNLSFATPERSEVVGDVVRYAANQGTLVVASAGNSSSSTWHYPAAEPTVLGVGAVGPDGTRWRMSNHGKWVDVVAPGDDILTTCPDNTYCLTAGTSIAAAMVAGSALLLAEHSGARGTRLRARLLDGADPVDGQMLHPAAGRGRLRIDRALGQAVLRLFGPSRVETAVAISGESAPTGGVERIIVVPGDAPGEAGWAVTLPASGLLHDGRTAVVVTTRETLSPAAADEVARLARGAAGVQIILPGDGWTGVSREVERALERYDVVRVGGTSAAETAAALADLVLASSHADRVLIARGDTFADALSLAGPAAAHGLPLLFVETDRVPGATCRWLGANGPTSIHVAGGPAAIADRVLTELRECGRRTTRTLLGSSTTTPTVTRDAGESRVETAVAIARRHFGDRVQRVTLANGWKWPDAVTGGALAASYGAPILVLPSDATSLPGSVAGYVSEVTPAAAFVLGGPVVIPIALEADVELRVARSG